MEKLNWYSIIKDVDKIVGIVPLRKQKSLLMNCGSTENL